jgi:hypothetical protein
MEKEELLSIVGDLYIRNFLQQKEIVKLKEELIGLKQMLMNFNADKNGTTSSGIPRQKDNI